jgi:predicted nucleic acid-binding protein
MTETLLDTGALIAYLDADDQWHEWVSQQWRALRPPMIVCEPVITETVFLLRGRGLDLVSLWELLRREILEIDFDLQIEFETIAVLMRRYADLPMDLADACLVRMAEKRHDVRVFTLDRDFKIYRRHGRQIIPLIFPD